jgi:hypothetical protein
VDAAVVQVADVAAVAVAAAANKKFLRNLKQDTKEHTCQKIPLPSKTGADF